eukprot:TRINITY_DN520_c0_g1_i9.p1 TRINITY_DN520_c0_g1~~TRINITY_DN520_c0_g1_i9.p1  ORF type:complete len:504 (-),score=78.48 TRINITY_DN520_c0_g1_i9:688-2199(-)
MASSNPLALKLLIHKRANHVVYAESGKDFVDILLSFLTMPVSSIIRLTTRHPKIGSLNTLYESVEDLDLHHMQSEACKTMLLHPRSTSEEQCKNLVLDIDDKTDPSEYYLCPFWICSSKTHCLVSTVANARCRCGQVMYRKVYRIKESDELDRRDGVFMKGSIDFIISDDLNVFPVSTSMGLELIKKVGINEATVLEQRNVIVGRREVLHLLNCMLHSKTPLTDVFLEEKDMIDGVNLDVNVMNLNLKDVGVDFKDIAQPQTEKEIEPDSKKVSLKLLMSKSNNRVLYAEGGEEFPNLLFSFLTFPLGSIVKCLGGRTTMGCLDNLYKSVEGLSNNDHMRSEECKAMLLDPKLALYFGCQNQLLQIEEQVPYQPTLFQCSSCSICVPYIKDYGNWTCSHGANKMQLRTLNPKYPNAAMEQGGTFMVGQAVFMVTDELIVKPLSSISGVSLLSRLNININDLEERFVTVGKAEALSILKASLISKTVLSDVFSSKKPRQKYTML